MSVVKSEIEKHSASLVKLHNQSANITKTIHDLIESLKASNAQILEEKALIESKITGLTTIKDQYHDLISHNRELMAELEKICNVKE